jgi:hypothetical protein
MADTHSPLRAPVASSDGAPSADRKKRSALYLMTRKLSRTLKGTSRTERTETGHQLKFFLLS